MSPIPFGVIPRGVVWWGNGYAKVEPPVSSRDEPLRQVAVEPSDRAHQVKPHGC